VRLGEAGGKLWCAVTFTRAGIGDAYQLEEDNAMIRKLTKPWLVAVSLLFGSSLLVACGDEPAEEVGEAIEEGGEAAGEAAEETGEAVEEATQE